MDILSRSPICALYEDLPPPSSPKITSLDSKTTNFFPHRKYSDVINL